MADLLVNYDTLALPGSKLPVAVRSELLRLGTYTPLRAALDTAAGSVALGIVGDSTGNEDASTTPEWVYRLAQKIAAKYTDHEVRYVGWDDVNQVMKPYEVLRAPATPRYVDFPGGNAQRAYWSGTPITGDMELSARITPTSWASGAEQVIVAQHSSTTDRGWYLAIAADGQLSFSWSTDGTGLKTAVVSGAWSPPAGPVWVRVRFVANDGTGKTVIKLFQSVDGVTWTQLGATITRGAVEPPFASVGGFQLGERGPTTSYFLGKIHQVHIRAGLDSNGPLVAPVLPEHWTPQQYCTGGQGTPIVTVVNGSHPGADLAYLTDSARLGKMTPNYGQVLTVISASHNEAFYHGPTVGTRVKGLAAAIRARIQDCAIGVCTQNPRTTPAPYITQHAQRRGEYMMLAQSQGYSVIDAYRALLEATRGTGVTLDDLTKGDGVHPEAAASEIWAAEAMVSLGL